MLFSIMKHSPCPCVSNYDDVEKGVKEALALLGGIDKSISPGEKVLLKPNMLEAVEKRSLCNYPSIGSH